MIWCLYGENAYQKQQAARRIIESAQAEYGESAIERYDGEQFDAALLASILQGASLFAAQKLVILTHASKQKVLWSQLEQWLPHMPEGTSLLLIEAAPDKRTKTFKLLQKHASVTEYKQLSEPEAASWLVDEAKEQGSHLTRNQSEHIVARAGTDQWRLHNELHKLLAHGVSDTAIDDLVEPTPQANIFALLDAALHKKPSELQKHLAVARSSEDPYMLYGLLSAQLLQLAALVHANTHSVDTIAKTLGVHPFPLKKMSPLAHQMSPNELHYIITKVAELDDALKSSGMNPWLLLEQTLHSIAWRPSGVHENSD